MVTKRVPTGTKTVRRKAASAPKPADGAAIAAPELPQESPQTSTRSAAVSASIDPDARRRLVAAEAYFLAERRGFAAGHEVEDWVAAEGVVDSQLEQTRAV